MLSPLVLIEDWIYYHNSISLFLFIWVFQNVIWLFSKENLPHAGSLCAWKCPRIAFDRLLTRGGFWTRCETLCSQELFGRPAGWLILYPAYPTVTGRDEFVKYQEVEFSIFTILSPTQMSWHSALGFAAQLIFFISLTIDDPIDDWLEGIKAFFIFLSSWNVQRQFTSFMNIKSTSSDKIFSKVFFIGLLCML